MQSSASENMIMSLGDHLEDLRRRIIFGLIGVAVALVFMLFTAKRLVAIICQPLIYELHNQGMQPSLEMPAITSAFGVYMKVAILGSIILGTPWILYQLWMFISPGLYAHERRFVVYLLPGSAILSTLGIAFMYFFMLPITMWFFIDFAQKFDLPELSPTLIQQRISAPLGDNANNAITLDPATVSRIDVFEHDPAAPLDGQRWINATENAYKIHYRGNTIVERFAPPILSSSGYHITEYISFVMMMALAFALSFQMPLVMLLLGYTRLLSFQTMLKGWKYVLLGCFVCAMFLTPPDPISQVTLAVPMFILYGFGLLLVKMTTKKRNEAFDAEI